MQSYYEATARERIAGILDPGSWHEILPPTARTLSPHLKALDLPVAFDDGVVIGSGALEGLPVLVAAQEGGFMGGAVGEVQGAKIVGLFERAKAARVAGVVLLLETGGVRLQEANAGLIAVSEVIRAICATRVRGIPVVAAIGGKFGCFGGMGIAAGCCTSIVMSEEGRLGLSGPEVIETAHGVEEFDSLDRALVWRTVGGKHRFLLGDCATLVDDRQPAFRSALAQAVRTGEELELASLEREQRTLDERLERFGAYTDGEDIWRDLGFDKPANVPLLATDALIALSKRLRAA
ncbi:MAG: biotin-independent malonate decarboxylase subunit beta [Betaproteobacteria bacterium]|nr:MAG: biotin-independent malonate decarboxylase subunit beta [Betaproteobacteria bacterium]